MNPKEPERKSSPAMAKLITVVMLALAAYSEVTTHHVDAGLTYGLVILAVFWAGQGIDRIFPLR